MSREITTHKGNALNDALTITSVGEAGRGGAHTIYDIAHPSEGRPWCTTKVELRFQSGDPAQDINGISNEALLAIVRDRLEGFQQGPFACELNGQALIYTTAAMDALASRTADRTTRGVEGKPQP